MGLDALVAELLDHHGAIRKTLATTENPRTCQDMYTETQARRLPMALQVQQIIDIGVPLLQQVYNYAVSLSTPSDSSSSTTPQEPERQVPLPPSSES